MGLTKQKITLFMKLITRRKSDDRCAKIQDTESLKVLYRELEKDAVMYQPEHFVIGFTNE